MKEYISRDNLIHNYVSIYKYKQLKKKYDTRAGLVEKMRDFLIDKGLLDEFLNVMEVKDENSNQKDVRKSNRGM